MVRGRLSLGGSLGLVALLLASPASAGKPGVRKPDPSTSHIPPEFQYTTTPKYRRFLSLVEAAGKGDVRTVQALLRRGVDVDGRDVGDGVAPGDRPLANAAAAGHLEVVNVLLAAGAYPDWCCCSCVTALHRAIRNEHPAVVARLIEAGASPQQPCDGKQTPLELARASGDAELIAVIERSLKDVRLHSMRMSQDRRAVEFYRDGDRELHRGDVLDKCGSPPVGEPKIRDIRRGGPTIQITYGKHCWAEVTVADLSIRCAGCD
jgi:hypothetical protein